MDEPTEDDQPIELNVQYERLNPFFADYAKNISRGGTFIRTRATLPVGTRFSFVLQVPTLDLPLRLLGKVMWVTSEDIASKANPAGMGIEIETDASENETIRQLVEGLMHREFGQRLTERLLGRAD